MPEEPEPYGFSKRLTEEEIARVFEGYNRMFGSGVGDFSGLARTYEDQTTETTTVKGGKTIRRKTFKGQWQDEKRRWHLGYYTECVDCGERLSEGHTMCCGHAYSGSMFDGDAFNEVFGMKGHECKKVRDNAPHP